jgi:hypothetical protein
MLNKNVTHKNENFKEKERRKIRRSRGKRAAEEEER